MIIALFAGLAHARQSLRRRIASGGKYVVLLGTAVGIVASVLSLAASLARPRVTFPTAEQLSVVRDAPIRYSNGATRVSVPLEELPTTAGVGFYEVGAAVVGTAEARHVDLAEVSAGLLDTLHPELAAGENWVEVDGQPAAFVSSEELARPHLLPGAVVGQKIVLNGRAFRIAGMLPRSFEFLSGVAFWVPFDTVPEFGDARRRPTVVLRRANVPSDALEKSVEDALRQKLSARAFGQLKRPVVLSLSKHLAEGRDVVAKGMVLSCSLLFIGTLLCFAVVRQVEAAAEADVLRTMRALGASGTILFIRDIAELFVLSILSAVVALLVSWASMAAVSLWATGPLLAASRSALDGIWVTQVY